MQAIEDAAADRFANQHQRKCQPQKRQCGLIAFELRSNPAYQRQHQSHHAPRHQRTIVRHLRRGLLDRAMDCCQLLTLHQHHGHAHHQRQQSHRRQQAHRPTVDVRKAQQQISQQRTADKHRQEEAQWRPDRVPGGHRIDGVIDADHHPDKDYPEHHGNNQPEVTQSRG